MEISWEGRYRNGRTCGNGHEADNTDDKSLSAAFDRIAKVLTKLTDKRRCTEVVRHVCSLIPWVFRFTRSMAIHRADTGIPERRSTVLPNGVVHPWFVTSSYWKTASRKPPTSTAPPPASRQRPELLASTVNIEIGRKKTTMT